MGRENKIELAERPKGGGGGLGGLLQSISQLFVYVIAPTKYIPRTVEVYIVLLSSKPSKASPFRTYKNNMWTMMIMMKNRKLWLKQYF